MRTGSLYLAATLALIPITGCGGGGGNEGGDTDGGTMGGDDDDPLQAPRTDWTIFVYGHGDHNLGPSLVADIREMTKASLNGKVNVVVMADWNGSVEPFSTGTQWYRIAGGGADPELIATGPELNLDEPEVLATAVKMVFAANPADHHGLIIWDHGGAWKLGFGSDTQDGTVKRPRLMGVREAAAAIAAGLDAAGLKGDRPLDFLSFDTCLMSGVEVISEMAPLARAYIANAEIDYGAGWDYTASFSWIAAHPNASASELARAETAAWDAHHRAQGGTDLLLRSHAAIDTSKWNDFVDAYAAFSAELMAGAGGIPVGRSLARSLPGFELSSVVDLGNAPSLRDVGQFLTFLAGAGDPALASRAQRARAALDAATFARANGDLRAAQAGVHIELPAATEIGNDMLTAYRSLAATWAERSGWANGLTRLASFADSSGPTFTHSIANAQSPTRDAPPALTFSSSAADVDSADVELGWVSASDPDSIYVLGMVATGTVTPRASSTYVWRGGAFTLPGANGQQQFITMGPWARLGANPDGEDIPPILQIIGLLTDGEGNQANGALLVDGGNGSIALAVIFTDSGNPAMFTLDELAGVTFTPLIPKLSFSTGEISYVAGAAFPLPRGGLGLGHAPLPPGAAALFTAMSDVWGNQEWSVDMVQLTRSIPE